MRWPPARPRPPRSAKLQAHGEELFNQRCKSCHMPPVEHAPSRSELAAQFPNVIVDALKTGKMQAMAAGLSDDRHRRHRLLGHRPGAGRQVRPGRRGQERLPGGREVQSGRSVLERLEPRQAEHPRRGLDDDQRGQRAQAEVKWAFAYQGGRYGQPTVVGNRVFVTSLLRPGLCAGQADRLRRLGLQGARRRCG